jgi:DNA adenine methylase
MRAPEASTAPERARAETAGSVAGQVPGTPAEANARPRRPILRYHGGKWRLAPWIISHFPPHRVYVEPFGGAASVLLRKPRSTVEVVNDLHERLVSAFRILRDPASAARLAELLYLTPYSKAEYLSCREIAPDPIEDARRLIVLAYQGHSSTAASGGLLTGWRRGDRGTRCTSAADWVRLPEQVDAWCERLREVYIECAEAAEVIARYDGPDTLFYVDPPYVGETRHVGSRAYAHELTDDQHRGLAEVLRGVSGRVVISGYDCRLYRELYTGWTRVEHRATADRAKSTVEVLWISPGASAAQGSLFEADELLEATP